MEFRIMVALPKIDTQTAANKAKEFAVDMATEKVTEVTATASNFAKIAKEWGIESAWVDDIVKTVLGWINDFKTALGLPAQQTVAAVTTNPAPPEASSKKPANTDAAKAAADRAKPRDTQVSEAPPAVPQSQNLPNKPNSPQTERTT